MAVDQARQYRHSAEIYDFRPCWDRKAFVDGFDLTVTNKNVLIVLYCAAIRIYQSPCFHQYNLGRRAGQPQTHNEQSKPIFHGVFTLWILSSLRSLHWPGTEVVF